MISADLSTADARAREATESVERFATHVMALPLTRLASVELPSPRGTRGSWNYWWQAHYLDALVDAGLRTLRQGDHAGARHWERRGRQVVWSVWLRNGARFHNRFYDDMAWMALATQRLGRLGTALGACPSWGVAWAQRRLGEELAQAPSPWGGCWWNKDHAYVNAAATAPVALWCARNHQPERATALASWLEHELADSATGLVIDGFQMTAAGRLDDRSLYTYNQGTTLGLALALGTPGQLERADALVESVRAHLSDDGVLRTHGVGDAGLFTGILARYLVLAALDLRLPEATRATAAHLVRTTADAVWAGSRVVDGRRRFPVFPPQPADDERPFPLSPQLQAWTVLEAAARLEHAR